MEALHGLLLKNGMYAGTYCSSECSFQNISSGKSAVSVYETRLAYPGVVSDE